MKKFLVAALIAILVAYCTFTDPNNGIQEEYYANGIIKSQETLKNGLRNGTAKYYNENGKLISKVEFRDDVKNGLLINYSSETGKPILEAYFKDGLQNGLVKQYYREGMLFRESNYTNDRVNGTIKTFWPDGKIKAENEFKMGKPGLGLKEFDKKGNQILQPRLIITKIKNNNAFELRVLGDFENVEFYQANLEEDKYFNDNGRKLPSDNGIGYFNSGNQKSSVKVSIVAKIKTTFGNTLILQKNI